MNGYSNDFMQNRIKALDEQICRQVSVGIFGYALALLAAVTLYCCFPFPLSRVGSVILIIALAQMIWKVYDASRTPVSPETELPDNPLLAHLAKLDAQIRLIESLIYNLPFVVGANLFFMGLPGTGSAERKAWLDCVFLLGTVLIFAICYWRNQQTLRKGLLPLRDQLERCVSEAESARRQTPRR